MPKRVYAAPVSAVPEDEGLLVSCGGEDIAIFSIDGQHFGCSARCPHAGGPLHQGFLDGTSVSCPWHGWAFELNCLGNAPRDGVERYRVVREGDDLFVELPE